MDRDYSFPRYLAAKRSVDDRALNAQVRSAFAGALAALARPSILEVGAGTGTMAARLQEEGILPRGTRYTAIDMEETSIELARQQVLPAPHIEELRWEAIDFFAFAARERDRQAWDVLIAHAFLDLVDLDHALPLMLSLLKPGGTFYFTINFDGVSILQPVIDSAFDQDLLERYHRTMDARVVKERQSGHSRTGRRLFDRIPRAGGEILAAGSSDWVVYPTHDVYPGDEAYFLHYIIDTIARALDDDPALDQSYFRAWIAERHAQVEAGSLVYIAHQLDFCGCRPAASGR